MHETWLWNVLLHTKRILSVAYDSADDLIEFVRNLP
jgi:hypothetical protein